MLYLKPTTHTCVFGIGNEKRLTGLHETSSMNTFTWGVANRNASVRINHKTIKEGCGYFEDRRPSANMNPYLVTAKIFETIQNIT
jgi:glutamine synthetase